MGSKGNRGAPPPGGRQAGNAKSAVARRLERDGVSVTYLNYASLSHSFLNWSGLIDDARHAATVTAALFGDAIRSRDVAALQTSRGAPPAVRGRP